MVDTADKYTYRVFWSEEDQEFVGLCAEFPSLSWLAETQQEALAGIRQVVVESVALMQQDGDKLPEPIATRQYSGKVLLRIPPDSHRALALEAAEEGVSLNRLISSKLV